MKKYIIKILNFLGKHLFAHALKDDSIERFTNYSLERSTKTFYNSMQNSTIIRDKEKFQKWCLEYSINNPTKEDGLFMEFGIYKGSSINRFAKMIPNKTIYGFDAFEGIEEDWKIDALKGKMDLKSKIPNLEKNVTLVLGWVQDTLDDFLNKNPQPLQFIHLDMDTFTPTNFVLNKIKKRLQKNTVILFDELHGYDKWESHEYKALIENLNEDEYQFIGFSKLQACIVITKDL